MRFISCLVVVLTGICAACSDTPTMPDRHGIPQVGLVCVPGSASLMLCRAPISCSLYPCAAGTPADVTQEAEWRVDDTSVAKMDAPGVVRAVGIGHTLLRVKWTSTDFWTPIAVFNGTAPLPTYVYEGMIYEGGAAPRTPLSGARVEILDGLAAGRSTMSGAMPDSYPGALPVATPGHYAFFGMPSGTYRLRVSRAGYQTQEIETRQMADVTLSPVQ